MESTAYEMQLPYFLAGLTLGLGDGNAGFSSRKPLVCLKPFCITNLADDVEN